MSQEHQNSPPSPSPQVPFWKVKIIQLIRGTIGILETAAVKLENPAPPVSEETPGFWQGLVTQWNRFLRQVRLFLPSKVSNNLSDRVLTGILALMTVVVVWSSVSIFIPKPTEVATVPPVEEVPEPIPEATPEPIPEPIPQPTPEPIPEPIPQPTPAPIPEPTATLELTPEENLIAAIKNQVAEISDRFASGLIESIQANFRTSNLTVKINDDWYILPESEQKQLAGEILQRSQELDFTHLEILDSRDQLIARNPVVGNEVIIFQRHIKIP
ncbi:hypothetical protein [Anabaenopsis elenkinii]|uniref:Uncharacterized protein n=1 Tax=Anabaenopsis elenkinii CCIBt3563 TaxID=2779889 RepID=A0A7S6RES8_9CYAN|nr:hypothetical protein [Anabaenopsis elenkinii]QOV23465.1 hypothetical protein IM676_03925 [Anabaenopsis elenkinii CCIBt3563]